MNLLPKFSVARAREIASRYELDEEVESLLNPNQTPADFLQVLFDQEHYLECVRFIAHGLPKREAVWWACLATRATHKPDTHPLRVQTLSVTENWVRKPSEELRQQAHLLAEKGKYKTSDCWAATAAYWSMGNVADNDYHPVSPPPFLYAHAVFGAVCLAATEAMPDDLNAGYMRFIGQGLDLAAGGKGMVQEDPLAPMKTPAAEIS